MLQSLSVKNFILIDELEIEFEKGLCVITGETGAGKSILLDAILFSLGNKSSDNIIKNGCDYCEVTTIFTLNNKSQTLLEQFNIEYDEELIIKRIQKSGNRKKFLINDQIVTQNTIQQITNHLFELHGQNNYTSLLSPSCHINILDDYGNLAAVKTELFKYFKELQEVMSEIDKINKNKDEINKEIDYLTFITDELANLNILEGEEEKLIEIRRNLQNKEKEIRTSQDILNYLEHPELNNLINNAQRLITRNIQQNKKLLPISSNLDECYNLLEEARIKLQNIVHDYNSYEFNINEIEDRLFLIRDKTRKYNISSIEIPTFLQDSQQKLKKLKSTIKNAESLSLSKLEKHQKYLELALSLSEKRSANAIKLEASIQTELAQLQMEKAIFKIEVTSKDNPSSQNSESINYNDKAISYNGIDNVRFTASINPGMKLAPIDKIASGGELSRFMLALKTCLFDKLSLNTIIFDEIDTGISGSIADKIGERLKKLSTFAQVIVITHQPQVAGKANQHILVCKQQLEKNTKISIKNLNLNERQSELARMISGRFTTDASLKAAKELLHP
ncbi:MAG: DNA repair protein RecN [Rickettsia endosymbiont of Bryobia graminum]|nr:DNA repair protein RecN [Rickettsia endosymbiont of Bryobia graminum]